VLDPKVDQKHLSGVDQTNYVPQTAMKTQLKALVQGSGGLLFR